MNFITKVDIATPYGDKAMEVYCDDIQNLDRQADILLLSSFYRRYNPTPGTIYEVLYQRGINVNALSLEPAMDLRDFCNTWLSRPIPTETASLPIGRIGCVELSSHSDLEQHHVDKTALLNTVKACFYMLDIASSQGVTATTVAMPLLGAGRQQIARDTVVVPLVSECIAYLKRNAETQRIMFVERNMQNAFLLAKTLESSYAVMKNQSDASESRSHGKPLAFISYSSKDKNIADNLVAKLEVKGVRCWYAPRDVDRDNYAQAIVEAIGRSHYFVVILSENSLKSEHVLNEIDLAFNETSRHIEFKPIRIDGAELCAAMKYYLSRKHWMDATLPPIEARLDEFVDKLTNNR